MEGRCGRVPPSRVLFRVERIDGVEDVRLSGARLTRNRLEKFCFERARLGRARLWWAPQLPSRRILRPPEMGEVNWSEVR